MAKLPNWKKFYIFLLKVIRKVNAKDRSIQLKLSSMQNLELIENYSKNAAEWVAELTKILEKLVLKKTPTIDKFIRSESSLKLSWSSWDFGNSSVLKLMSLIPWNK